MSEKDLGTYQMLWDCPYCGTEKLLGLNHRHCPGCGAAQDPSKRYFPKDEDKIAVENHQYVGADRVCASCDSPNSVRAAHCTNCGSPMEGTKEVERKQDGGGPNPPAQPPQKPSSPPGKSRWKLWALVSVAVVIGLVVLCTRKEDVRLTVTGHEWKREVRIEAYKTVRENHWCSDMPSGAHNVSRTREVKSHTQEPDGETCHTERKDNGDGSFSEKEVCKTKYRKVPVYADKCHYEIEKWVHARDAVAKGAGLSPEPQWPEVSLSSGGIGTPPERQGQRSETYTVRFKKSPAGEGSCDLPYERYRTFAVGSTWSGTQSLIGKQIDCASLKPGS